MTTSQRHEDRNIRGLHWPKWLRQYEPWHPLHSTGYDVYKEEAFARDARRYKISRGLLAAAYENLKRFEDASLPQRARVAAGERAADQFTQAHYLADERRAEMQGRLLGDQAVAAVLVSGQPTGALIATRFPRTIIDRQMARHFGARSTGRRGSVPYRGRRLRGHYVEVIVTFEKRSAEVIAFVPLGRFAKGFLLGRDWVERMGAKLVDGEIAISKQIPRHYRAERPTVRGHAKRR